MSNATVNLIGRLTSDPEFRTGKEDREFCTFNLAVNQQLGPQENTSFYNCTGNSLIATRIKKAGVIKGRMIQVTGNLTLREYQTQNGATRMSADVGILDWSYVGSKPKSDEKQEPASSAGTNNGKTGKVNDECYISGDDDLPL